MHLKTVVEKHSEGYVSPAVRVFLSHAHSDRDVAEIIDEWIKEAFRGLITVFRSSDRGQSINIGDPIKNSIKTALKDSVASLVLCSHASINRPWVNIELGAAWMLDATIIPLCVPGLKNEDLPFQLSDVKVCQLDNEESCIELLELLLKRVGTKYPYKLGKGDITKHAKTLHEKIKAVMEKRRPPPPPPEPLLRKRKTVWIFGSYSDLGDDERRIAEKIVPMIAHGACGSSGACCHGRV